MPILSDISHRGVVILHELTGARHYFGAVIKKLNYLSGVK
jgi:hypothetical protein